MRCVGEVKQPADGWTPLAPDQYDAVWSRFEERYSFRASVDPSRWPAIEEPAHSVTFDLSDWDDEADWSQRVDRLDADALSAFKVGFSSEPDLIVLDWQHPAFRFDHHRVEVMSQDEFMRLNLPLVYPDGDYIAFMTTDMSEGTFGHPWEKTLCVIGPRLGSTLVPVLDRWLPRKRTN